MYFREESYNKEDDDVISTNDLFMQDFKHYKKLKQTDFEKQIESVLYLDSINESNIALFNLKVAKLNFDIPEYENLSKKYGLIKLENFKCYESLEQKGLFLIPNPFLAGYQRYLVKKCLCDYHSKPNKTNLDIHTIREGNLWNNELVKINDFSEFNKLRWTTLGYHYDWTKKIYNENDYTPIPSELYELMKLIANIVGYDSFKPEAGIINYYHLNSTLSGHKDRSEKNLSAPLISVSLGNSALFLIGGESKDIKPKAIVLKSGDILIMSDESRLSYHGVPKIFKDKNIGSYFEYDKKKLECSNFLNSDYYVDDEKWTSLFEYIKLNRLNLNIRQVF